MVKWISRKTDRNPTDDVRFKRAVIQDWTSRAEYYHCNWVMENAGPFMATSKLVNALEVQPNDIILDLACGTGAVSREISCQLTGSGMLVGVDLSRAAISIANSWVPSLSNCSFMEMDAENLGFRSAFDKVACQYALMFFPDPKKAMKEIKNIMKSQGRIGVAVHGTIEGVPYFSTITLPISKFIPDYPSKGVSFVHRFGRPEDLKQILIDSGFSDISISRYTFEYTAGSFENYWSDFFSNGYGSPLQPIVFNKKNEVISNIKSEARKLASRYLKNDTIQFPWEVLIAIGRS
jgi:ubiquinone/menaquinone biosynthesis C-methylase UbiE